MKATIATVVLLCCCAFASGQQLNSKGKGPDREIVGPKGNRIHHFLSAPAEKVYRAQHAMNGRADLEPACGSSPPGCTTGPLAYGGGPVMRNPTNYLIFWRPASSPQYASAFPAGYQAGVENFFENIGGTPYYNIVTQYGDSSGTPVPNAASLGAPSWTDTTTAAPSGCDGTPTGTVGSTPHCPLTDGDIQNEVSVALAANPTWAAPGVNVEYFVYTPSNVGECDGPGSDGNQQCFASSIGLGPSQDGAFCAYHSFFSSNTIYAFIPFASNGSCYGPTDVQALGYPNSQTLDIVLSPSSHEMIESNTDPLINAWKGSGGNSDEIGDKCAYIYGYVAPDGTNVVLHGNRYQIQEEFSNDFGSCTKRYGPDPVVANPGTLAFGEVQDGTSSQMGSTIQNNGGGDLNILSIRLGTESDGFNFYSLVNGQPTGATLPGGESLTANVQFAPSSSALFGSPSDSLIVDTDQTPCDTNGSCATPSTTKFSSITGTIGVDPDALCNSVSVSTDFNLCSNATASVNHGSFDPDGEGVTVTQSPAGPYTLGVTPVLLTVVDNGPDRATASCSANVTVVDMQKPNISCPAATTVMCTSSSGAAVAVNPTFSDNCPAVTASCVPSSGSTFGFGTTPVTCTATDASGNQNSCMTTVTVADVPPTITSAVASPAVISPPNKKLDPVTILVKDTDVCDPAPVCSINGVSLGGSPAPASDFVITGPLTLQLRANGSNGHPMTYIVGVTCADHHGGSTSAQATVSAP
ncbi:MAG TPA: HYR domain-containing protein [Terracidiphilus sp.]|nr:HYR domain-containing protein [Terracidiphilus sp.]